MEIFGYSTEGLDIILLAVCLGLAYWELNLGMRRILQQQRQDLDEVHAELREIRRGHTEAYAALEAKYVALEATVNEIQPKPQRGRPNAVRAISA